MVRHQALAQKPSAGHPVQIMSQVSFFVSQLDLSYFKNVQIAESNPDFKKFQ
jgi:uncharacterized protein YneR